jgi:hypothetical protein
MGTTGISREGKRKERRLDGSQKGQKVHLEEAAQDQCNRSFKLNQTVKIGPWPPASGRGFPSFYVFLLANFS